MEVAKSLLYQTCLARFTHVIQLLTHVSAAFPAQA